MARPRSHSFYGAERTPTQTRVRHLTPGHPPLSGIKTPTPPRAWRPNRAVASGPRRPLPLSPGGGDPRCTEARSPRVRPGDVGDGVGAVDSESETKLGAGRALRRPPTRTSQARWAHATPPPRTVPGRACTPRPPGGTGPAPPAGNARRGPTHLRPPWRTRAASRQAAGAHSPGRRPHAAPTQPAPAPAPGPAAAAAAAPAATRRPSGRFPSHGGGRGRGRAGQAGRAGETPAAGGGRRGRAGGPRGPRAGELRGRRGCGAGGLRAGSRADGGAAGLIRRWAVVGRRPWGLEEPDRGKVGAGRRETQGWGGARRKTGVGADRK